MISGLSTENPVVLTLRKKAPVFCREALSCLAPATHTQLIKWLKLFLSKSWCAGYSVCSPSPRDLCEQSDKADLGDGGDDCDTRCLQAVPLCVGYREPS